MAKNWNNNIFENGTASFLAAVKHNKKKVSEEYCWAITQARDGHAAADQVRV